jgi:orotate phosphoribosyltransferase
MAVIKFIAENSVLEGEFTLASGLKSNVYVDVRLSSMLASGGKIIGEAFSNLLLGSQAGVLQDSDVTLIGLELGAIPVMAAISATCGLDYLVVRKEAKDHGTARPVEGNLSIAKSSDLQGRVVVIDDVWTTGGSTMKAVEAARAAGLTVIAAACLVDREQGSSELLRSNGIDIVASVLTFKQLLEARGIEARTWE